jgi:hypothetical protein
VVLVSAAPFRSELEAAHEKARRAEARVEELQAKRLRLEKQLTFMQKRGHVAGLITVCAFFSAALMASFLWSKIRIVEGNAADAEARIAEAVAGRMRTDAERAACELKTEACLAAKTPRPVLLEPKPTVETTEATH